MGHQTNNDTNATSIPHPHQQRPLQEHASETKDAPTMGHHGQKGQIRMETDNPAPTLGDLVIVLLAGTLTGIAANLTKDGYDRQADFITDLVDQCDSFITGVGLPA